MSEIYNIKKPDTENLQTELQDSDSDSVENIVEIIVEDAKQNNGSLPTKIFEIAEKYEISYSDAKNCLNLAKKELENSQNNKSSSKEQLYAQSGYYYPKNSGSYGDSMDNLSLYSNYNKMMFGL